MCMNYVFIIATVVAPSGSTAHAHPECGSLPAGVRTPIVDGDAFRFLLVPFHHPLVVFEVPQAGRSAAEKHSTDFSLILILNERVSSSRWDGGLADS